MLFNTYLLIDCLDLLRSLPDGSVDFLCVDPPYRTTQLPFDRGQPINWPAWWVEANRVVRPAGVVCIFASGPFTFAMYATNPKAWRYTLVWEKTRLSRFLDANRRPLQAHEDILVFCRQPGKATYNPQKTYHPERKKKRPPRPANGTDHYAAVGANLYEDTGMRHPGTVLKFNSPCNTQTINKTQKPADLLRWLIRAYSNPGDLVVDTCAGSGTVGVVCQQENRRWLCGDNDPDQHAKATKRLDQATQTLRLDLRP